jgi:hypothetical protein
MTSLLVVHTGLLSTAWRCRCQGEVLSFRYVPRVLLLNAAGGDCSDDGAGCWGEWEEISVGEQNGFTIGSLELLSCSEARRRQRRVMSGG